MRVDSHHRVFYIDHNNRTTTWEKPENGQRTIHRRPTISFQQKRDMDRRYQSIRRTIRQKPEPEPTSNSAESSSSGMYSASFKNCTYNLFMFIFLYLFEDTNIIDTSGNLSINI